MHKSPFLIRALATILEVFPRLIFVPFERDADRLLSLFYYNAV